MNKELAKTLQKQNEKKKRRENESKGEGKDQDKDKDKEDNPLGDDRFKSLFTNRVCVRVRCCRMV